MKTKNVEKSSLTSYKSWFEVWKIIPIRKYIGGTIEVSVVDVGSLGKFIYGGIEDERKMCESRQFFRVKIIGINRDKDAPEVFWFKGLGRFDRQGSSWLPMNMLEFPALCDLINGTPKNGVSKRIYVDGKTSDIVVVSAPLNCHIRFFHKDEPVPETPIEPFSFKEFVHVILKTTQAITKN